VSVESGVIWWSGKHSESGEVAGRGEGSRVLADTAEQLAKTFPEKSAGGASAGKPIDPKTLTKLAVILAGEQQQRPLSRQPAQQSDQQRLVEDEFVQALMQKGYRLVSRSDIQALAQEQQFQRSGLTESNAVAVGKLLNIPAVLVVRITDFGTDSQRDPRNGGRPVTVARATIGARLVNVETGLIWWTRSHTASDAVADRGGSGEVLAAAAKNVAESFPPVKEAAAPSNAGRDDPKNVRAQTMLNSAANLERTRKTAAALNYYRDLLKTYPDSPQAETARERIKALEGK
jgi:hypothetical protein